MNFDNCTFAAGAKFEPNELTDLKLGFANTITGLDISNVPVQAILYFRMDAIGHPRLLGVDQDESSTVFETINRPVGWKTNGRVPPQWQNGSTPGSRTIFTRLLTIDPETCAGGLVFPLLSNSAGLGSFRWDIGTPIATFEAAITFTADGRRTAGLLGRSAEGNELDSIHAWLDKVDNQPGTGTVNIKVGLASGNPTDTELLPIELGAEYILTA